MFLYIGLFVVALAFLLFKHTRKPRGFPPGPPRLPVVGSIPYLVDNKVGNPSLRINDKMEAKYGKIWGSYIGNMPMIKIGDYKMAKELLTLDTMQDRPDEIISFLQFRPGYKLGNAPGVVGSKGQHWKEQRRFALRNLRDLGFGKTSMEDSINDEVDKFNEIIKNKEGQPIDLTVAFNASILNVLWSIAMGTKMELDDPKLLKALEEMNNFFRAPFATRPLLALLPSMKWAWLPGLRSYAQVDTVKKSVDGIVEHVQEHMDEHKKTLDMDAEPRDFMDMFLHQIKKEKDPKSSMYGEAGHISLLNTFSDLFIAGSETTSSSLMWTILYMVHHPEVQARVHAELDQVLDSSRAVSLEDQESLPYTNAVLQESFRMTGLAFDSVPHQAAAEVTFHGYTIPKGSIVMSSLFQIMRDPEHFPEPNTFNPSRFIDSNGKFIKDEHVCPFGIGKRYCLGQSLAEKEYFLYFAGIMKRFLFKSVPGMPLPGYNRDDVIFEGSARNPPADLRVLAIDRQKVSRAEA